MRGLRHTATKVLVVHTETLLMIVLSAVFTFQTYRQVEAADLINRRVTIASPMAGLSTTHTFSFNLMSGSLLGSIEFEYCDNTPLIGAPCTAPPGLSVDGAGLASQTGEVGFSIHPSSSGNRLVLTRLPDFVTPQPSSYELANVVNPTDAQRSVFVRISTFSTNNATGSRIDEGAVVFSTARGVAVGGFVPPYLTFCVGASVALDCSTTTGSNVNLGELSRTSPSLATSQFAGATNDYTGYAVGVYGNTMTSGNNVIPALGVNGSSSAGTSQYGMNLRQNTAPTVGQNAIGGGTAAPTIAYSIPNSFRFVSGDTIVRVLTPSDFNKFTVSYLVNVSTAQDPGVYATTMTYVATASF